MRFFLVIGAQKAGTSWLHAQLRRHPEVHLPKWKELHYFDIARPPLPRANFTGWYVREAREALRAGNRRRAENLLEALHLPYADADGSAYREYLTRGAPGDVRTVGEVTPAYATLTRDGFRFAHEVLDAPHVVFVMREPLERYWSALRMEQRRGLDPVERFGRAALGPATWARCDYRATITELEAVFPQELIHYTFYEELFSPQSLGALAEFLGVDPEWPWDLDERVLAGREMSMPEPSPELLERFRPVYEFVRERFGDRVPASWRSG